jgi:hypothetical protein
VAAVEWKIMVSKIQLVPPISFVKANQPQVSTSI